MNKLWIAVLFLGGVSLMGSLPASAGTLYSTLGAGGSFNTGSGWNVSGTNYGGISTGTSFTLAGGYTISEATLALEGGSPVSLFLESDNGGAPGSILATLLQVGSLPSNQSVSSLVNFTCTTAGCDVAAGKYWLVASQTNANTIDSWMFNSTGATTTIAQKQGAGAFSTYAFNTAPAYEVDGGLSGVTPEPSSFVLLGTGLVGLVGMGRRKLKV